MSDTDSVVTVDELNEDVQESQQQQQQQSVGHQDTRRTFGDNYGRRFGPPQMESELASKVLLIESKKFYVDVKESRRGRIVKISEVSLNGQKNRMTMEMKSAIEFHDKLTEFIEKYSAMGPRPRDGEPRNVMSETIFAVERRYYLDLKENKRGRFLKISMTMPPPSYDRADIVVPAQGMVDLRDALTDLLNEYGKGCGATVSAPQPVVTKPVEAEKEESGLALKTEGKTFYFTTDNKHGVQLKISEVRSNFRTAVNVPREIWDQFRELLRTATGMQSCTDAEEAMEGYKEEENCIADYEVAE